MNYLDQLEQQSVYILREAFRHFERLCMLWSIGKDSTVLLWLARKAFFGHVPFPLVHIDTSYKLPEMITYRDRLALEYKLTMIVGQTSMLLRRGARSRPPNTFPKATRTKCLGWNVAAF
jgi:sulfate adenylyltransferase subunit 2